MTGSIKISCCNALRKPQGLLLVVCFIALSACQNDLSTLPPETDVLELSNDRASDVTFIYSEKGKTKARIHTKDFVGNESAKPPYIDFLNGVKMDMYNDSMQIESTVTARNARYYTQSDNIIARDSVVVRNSKGEMLQTEELIWNQKLERFYTDKFVRITYGDQVSWGEGLEATQDFSWFQIRKQRGSIPVNNDELPTD